MTVPEPGGSFHPSSTWLRCGGLSLSMLPPRGPPGELNGITSRYDRGDKPLLQRTTSTMCGQYRLRTPAATMAQILGMAVPGKRSICWHGSVLSSCVPTRRARLAKGGPDWHAGRMPPGEFRRFLRQQMVSGNARYVICDYDPDVTGRLRMEIFRLLAEQAG